VAGPLSEITGQQSQLNAVLDAGIETLSSDQTIAFTLYTRVVLPADGYAFWVRADLLSPSARSSTTSPFVVNARGSLHIATQKVQEEAEVYGIQRVVFTSEDQIHQDFNTLTPNDIYIGQVSWATGGAKFAFSNRENYYRQAGINHYQGDAVYPFMSSQVIDDPRNILDAQIVSNSLPIWLRLNNYTPFYGFGNQVPLYPSQLLNQNISPPFGAIHIPPESTEAIASAPWLGFKTSTHNQLCRETVRVTLYGCTNDQAMNFVDCVLQYSEDYNYIGMGNMPVMRDEKRSQNELYLLAMKKSITFDVSYFQHSSRQIAMNYISQALVDVTRVLPQSWPDPYL
jgi:hypothetical protein